MTILLVLIPLGLVLLGLAIAAFVWAVRHGQFDDLEGEGERILYDEDRPAPPPQSPSDPRAASSGIDRGTSSRPADEVGKP
jgi:cbb3-type cytochrome oxidase maturation protein